MASYWETAPGAKLKKGDKLYSMEYSYGHEYGTVKNPKYRMVEYIVESNVAFDYVLISTTDESGKKRKYKCSRFQLKNNGQFKSTPKAALRYALSSLKGRKKHMVRSINSTDREIKRLSRLTF